MEWLTLPFLTSLTATVFALFALARSTAAARMTARLSAEIATFSSALSDLERSERLTPSKLAELAEFKESVSRAEDLLVKVNRREIARAKRRDDEGQFTGNGNVASIKDQLRARAGLVAGRPAPHA